VTKIQIVKTQINPHHEPKAEISKRNPTIFRLSSLSLSLSLSLSEKLVTSIIAVWWFLFLYPDSSSKYRRTQNERE